MCRIFTATPSSGITRAALTILQNKRKSTDRFYNHKGVRKRDGGKRGKNLMQTRTESGCRELQWDATDEKRRAGAEGERV